MRSALIAGAINEVDKKLQLNKATKQARDAFLGRIDILGKNLLKITVKFTVILPL